MNTSTAPILRKDIEKTTKCKVWFKNGIIYAEYAGMITVEDIFYVEKKAVDIIEEKDLGLIPFIGIMSAIQSVKLGISDYARVVSHYDISTHASGVWIVDAPFAVKSILKTISVTFYSDRIKFCDSIEQAELEIKKFVRDTSIIDNPDTFGD